MVMLRRLKSVYFIKQVGDCFLFSFLSLYLTFYGFNDYTVGALMGITPLVMLVATPALGLLDNGRKRGKILLVCCTALTGTIGLSLIIPKMNYVLIAVILFVLATTRSPIGPSLDSMTTVTAANCNRSYAEVRVMASIAYSLTMGACGFLIDLIGFTNILIIGCCLYLICAVITTVIDVPSIDSLSDTTPENEKSERKSLFKNRPFITFTVMQLLIFSTFLATFNFDGIIFAERFDNASTYGIFEGVRAAFEVLAILIFSRSKRRLNVKTTYVIFGLGLIVRCLSIYFNLPTSLLLFSYVLIGFAFGLSLVYNIPYIGRTTTKRALHIAISFNASALLLCNALYTYLGTAVVKIFGLKYVFLFFTALTVIGMAYTVLRFKEVPDSPPTVLSAGD